MFIIFSLLLGGEKVLLVGSKYQIDLGDRFAAIGHTSDAIKMMAKLRIRDEPKQCIASDTTNDGYSFQNRSVLTSDVSHVGGLEKSSSEAKASAAPSDEKKKNLERNLDVNLHSACTKYIKQNGVWRRNIFIEWVLICVPVALFITAGILLRYLRMPMLATMVLSIAHTKAGWKAHDICHDPGRRNSWLRTLFSAMCTALSTHWWSRRHNASHHCYPNMVSVDDDIDTSPVLMHKISNRWIHKFQHIYYMIPFSFLKFSWRLQSVPAASILELILFSTHYIIGIYVFGAKLFFISILIDGEISAMVTTLNHDAEVKTGTPGDFFQQTLQTTVDIDVPWGISFLFGHMQYQTIHHLFPYIPSYRYENLVPVIREFCQNHGLEYRIVSMWEAYTNHKKYYYDVVRKSVVGSVLEESYYENDGRFQKKSS